MGQWLSFIDDCIIGLGCGDNSHPWLYSLSTWSDTVASGKLINPTNPPVFKVSSQPQTHNCDHKSIIYKLSLKSCPVSFFDSSPLPTLRGLSFRNYYDSKLSYQNKNINIIKQANMSSPTKDTTNTAQTNSSTPKVPMGTLSALQGRVRPGPPKSDSKDVDAKASGMYSSVENLWWLLTELEQKRRSDRFSSFYKHRRWLNKIELCLFIDIVEYHFGTPSSMKTRSWFTVRYFRCLLCFHASRSIPK